MFCRLVMKLRSPQEIRAGKASAFQGLLFDFIDPEYASVLHRQQMHPYSQYLIGHKEETLWIVNTLTDEAYEQIIKPLLREDLVSLNIKQGNLQAEIVSRQMGFISSKELVKQFVHGDTQRRFRIDVLTPTAFKRAGHYYLFPEPRMIYQSLMNRYSLLCGEFEMADPDTLDQISEATLVTGYRLKTVRFPIEGITLPGFTGSFTISIKGTETMARYVRMLLTFGEYSGIGIKTAMGMGAIRLNTQNHVSSAKRE